VTADALPYRGLAIWRVTRGAALVATTRRTRSDTLVDHLDSRRSGRPVTSPEACPASLSAVNRVAFNESNRRAGLSAVWLQGYDLQLARYDEHMPTYIHQVSRQVRFAEQSNNRVRASVLFQDRPGGSEAQVALVRLSHHDVQDWCDRVALP
jgi:hypothetical protein